MFNKLVSTSNDLMLTVLRLVLGIVFFAHGQSWGERIVAVPGNSGPVIRPRMVQGATRTHELLRRRLYLPESLRVMT